MAFFQWRMKFVTQFGYDDEIAHERFCRTLCCDRTAAKMCAAQEWMKWIYSGFWLSSCGPNPNITVGRSVGFLCQQPKRSLGSSAWPKHVRSIHR
jgi:hypothetical protein